MIPKKNKLYTYKDYLTFTDDERIEIIEGEIFNMSQRPAPPPHPSPEWLRQRQSRPAGASPHP